MGWKKLLRTVTSKPDLHAIGVAMPFLGLTGYEFWKLFTNRNEIQTVEEGLLFASKVFSPMLAYVGSALALRVFRRATYDSSTLERIAGCAQRVKQQEVPHFQDSGTVEITANLKDFAFNAVVGNDSPAMNRKRYAEYGRKNKHPGFLHEAAVGYLYEKEFDEGLLCLRDALDLLGGKRPKLNWKHRIGMPVDLAGLAFDRFSRPDAIELYLLTAGLYALSAPEKAWYYSKLAKEIATELNQLKKEAHVFDSLLATAQKRTDTESCWGETFKLLLQTGQPERIGESRNPVWVLKDEGKQFFSSTFAFKGNKDRNALVNEQAAMETIDDIVAGDGQTAKVLHITPEPYNGYYAYCMRYAAGETLHDRILKNDCSAVPKVTQLLAKILARYPTTGLQTIDIEKKTKDKLYAPELGIPTDLANKILAHIGPVNRAITEHAVITINKDGHPQQWQIGKDASITVLDGEITYTHPAILESANLYAYTKNLALVDEQAYVILFANALRQQGTQLSNPALSKAYSENNILFRAYHNGVIHRALCWVSAWSDPERPTMRAKRADAIQRAIVSIERLDHNDQKYYNDYKEDYQELHASLEKMRELIVP